MYTHRVLYTQSGAAIEMDVNCNPIAKWHRGLVLDHVFSGEFTLVDSTAATGYIRLYIQL